eukprot:COSAG01_NODE_985_length_12329_cov_363.217171_13_plen_75_part_00
MVATSICTAYTLAPPPAANNTTGGPGQELNGAANPSLAAFSSKSGPLLRSVACGPAHTQLFLLLLLMLLLRDIQ